MTCQDISTLAESLRKDSEATSVAITLTFADGQTLTVKANEINGENGDDAD